ncbi:MAG: hypothetical protein H0U89_03665 [Acidimicrobiia bacterium]|nr:hypothetical protein [Acidimicrobiia bacterium]
MMSKTRGGHNLKATVVMALIAVLLLVALVVTVEPVATTSDRDVNPASQSMTAEGKGGSSLAQDPIHRHVEVVARLGEGSLR